MTSIIEAKQRLDKLIKKGRHCLYKPMQIAEILYRHRTQGSPDPSNLESYRRISNKWKADIALQLLGRKPVLNSRYEDQLFDEEVIPPRILSELGKANTDSATPGVVEVYIYDKVGGSQLLLAAMVKRLESIKTTDFELKDFIQYFENDPRLKRSVDKIYEIIVYALFDTITSHLQATVTLSVREEAIDILKDFEKFAKIVLGVDRNNLTITERARLFRLGVTNAADARIDMWANFGPAIQVKHVTLDPKVATEIANELMAEKIVVVCKTAEKRVVESVMNQVGLKDRIRGFITEKDLVEWYSLCVSMKYSQTIGKDVILALLKEFRIEFPLTESMAIEKLFAKRGYSRDILKGIWAEAG